MATVLTHAIISSATEKVDTYVATASGLYDELSELISTLTSSNFIGDAAEGYKDFFNSKVTPALTENLTTGSESLMEGIKKLLENIQTQLLDTIDPQLGENNSNPG